MTIQAINEAMDIADDSSSRHRDSCYSSSSIEDWYVVLDDQPGCSRGDQRSDTLTTMHMAQINELEDHVESELNEIEVKSTES